jgi:hypothetical protein
MKTKKKNADLPETKDDKKHLKPDKGILDLPDVKDIPGQEHVRPLPPGEKADYTISSADEEADYLFDEDKDKLEEQYNSNVTGDERELLEESSHSMAEKDDQQLKAARVDSKDEDGTPLNEKINPGGSDLDIPGAELDDADEEIGEEDEENNVYSMRGEDEDQSTGKQ